jgi:hypothetical protein
MHADVQLKTKHPKLKTPFAAEDAKNAEVQRDLPYGWWARGEPHRTACGGSSKFEYRNAKQIRNPNSAMTETFARAKVCFEFGI